MNENSVGAFFQKFFTLPEIDAKSPHKYIEDFAKKNKHKQLIQLIFRTMQSCTSKENLKIVYKRYLFLINQILTIDQRFPEHFKYRQTISQLLPTHYLFVLKKALANATDLLIQLKCYRKRWAKRITDEAFYAIHRDALKTLRFDLDKGFPKDQIEKVLKEYKRRKFTNSEINKYMALKKKENLGQSSNSDTSSDSDEEISKPQKKVKIDKDDSQPNRYSRKTPAYNDSMTPHSSFNSSLGTVTHHISYPDPRLNHHYPTPPYQYSNPYFQNSYHPPPYYPPNQFYQPPQHPPPSLPSYANSQYPPTYYQSHHQSYGNQVQPTRKGTQVYNTMHQFLDSLKSTKTYECKFCGLLLSIEKKYEEHMQTHFSEAQKQYETSHSRRDHARKSLMPSTDEWLGLKKYKDQELKHYVGIKGGQFGNNTQCIICGGDLKISWLSAIDSWVFKQAMKVRMDQEQKICHEECYQIYTDYDQI